MQPVRHNKTADKFFLQNQPVTACGINNNNFFSGDAKRMAAAKRKAPGGSSEGVGRC